MRLAIFGATGYAGSRIIREALQRGHEVVAIARHAESAEGDVEWRTVRSGSLHDQSFVDEIDRPAHHRARFTVAY